MSSHKRYTAVVRIDRDEEWGDRAVVTVNGHRWTGDHHWSDSVKGHARRAVEALFNVGHVVSVEPSPGAPAGAVALFTVTAEL